MDKMKELFLKIDADTKLQDTLKKILEEAGEDADVVGKRLIQFAKEQGFDVTAEEIFEFFNFGAVASGRQMSDEEMDSVAGGMNDRAAVSTWLRVCDGGGETRVSAYSVYSYLYCAR